MDFIASDSVADAVQHQVHSIRSLLDEYEAALPQSTCKKFLTGIRLIVWAVEDYHKEWCGYLSSAYGDKPGLRSTMLRSTSENCIEVLSNVQQELLPLIDASLRQPPFLIQPTLERGISLFTKTDFEFTLAPSFRYQYAFVGKHKFVATELERMGNFSAREERLKQALELPEWNFFLAYPLVERESALNQVVMAHELAHVVSHLGNIHDPLLPSSLDAASFAEYVEKFKASPENNLASPDQVENHCYQVCVTMIKSWVQEIVSDVIALHALGPAYFFSILEFFANVTITDSPDELHPAPSYFGRLLTGELEHLRYFTVQTAVTGDLKSLLPRLDAAAQTAVKKYEPAAVVAHKTIEASLPEVLHKLREICDKFSYKAENYLSEVPRLVNQLKQGLLPADSYVPGKQPKAMSAIAILNAGWELCVTQKDAFPALFRPSILPAQKLLNLNRLLFKSLETNEVVRAYFS